MLEVEVDPIPEEESAYDEWFKRNEEVLQLRKMGMFRRAWSGRFNTYLCGEDCVIYTDGGPVEFGLMSELTIVKAIVEVEVDPIPEEESAYDEWFKRNEEVLQLRKMGMFRRAWSGRFNTYLRGEDCVIYTDGGPVEFGLMSELTIVEEGK